MKRQTPREDPRMEDEPLAESLRWQLRALRRDELPRVDLWPGIAAQLTQPRTAPRASPASRPTVQRWAMPVALAATLVIALGITGWWHGASSGTAPSLIQREAHGLTVQYQAALAEIATRQPVSPTVQPALDDLDQSERLILDALARDPDSRLLLQQLRRTYSHRLALAQRIAIT